MPEDALFCGNCGMKVENPEPSVKETPAAENQSYQPYTPEESSEEKPEGISTQPASSAYNNSIPENDPYSYNKDGSDLNTTLWIILSVIEIVLCCSTVTGVIALIFSIIANNKKNQGNYAEAASNLKTAKVVFFVGLALFVFGIIFFIASGMLAIFTGI